MKRFFVLFVVFVWLWGFVSAFLEDKIYCDVSESYVKVYLKKWIYYTCGDYISTLDASLLDIKNKLDDVELYLQAGQNVTYWQSVYDDLNYRFQSFQTIRANVVFRINEFEYNLFTVLKKFLVNKLVMYKSSIEFQLSYYKDVLNTSYSQQKVKDELQKQLNMILLIENSKNLEELFKYLSGYFYVKNNFLWK